MRTRIAVAVAAFVLALPAVASATTTLSASTNPAAPGNFATTVSLDGDISMTANEVVITLPAEFVNQLAGFATCTAATAGSTPSSCPAGSQLGTAKLTAYAASLGGDVVATNPLIYKTGNAAFVITYGSSFGQLTIPATISGQALTLDFSFPASAGITLSYLQLNFALNASGIAPFAAATCSGTWSFASSVAYTDGPTDTSTASAACTPGTVTLPPLTPASGGSGGSGGGGGSTGTSGGGSTSGTGTTTTGTGTSSTGKSSAKPPSITGAAKPKTTKSGSTILVTTGQTLKCPSAGPSCTATVTFTTTKIKKQIIGTAKITAKAGKKTVIKVRLTASGARLLRKNRTVVVKISTKAKAGSGAAKTTTKDLTLHAPR